MRELDLRCKQWEALVNMGSTISIQDLQAEVIRIKDEENVEL